MWVPAGWLGVLSEGVDDIYITQRVPRQLGASWGTGGTLYPLIPPSSGQSPAAPSSDKWVHRDAGDYRRGRTAISLNHGDDFKAESLANTMYTHPPEAEVWQHTSVDAPSSAKVNNLSGAILARPAKPRSKLWEVGHRPHHRGAGGGKLYQALQAEGRHPPHVRADVRTS